MSLLDAQANFAAIGVCEEAYVSRVRAARPDDARDPRWRPLDPTADILERPIRGVDYGSTYPRDLTELYYWWPKDGQRDSLT